MGRIGYREITLEDFMVLSDRAKAAAGLQQTMHVDTPHDSKFLRKIGRPKPEA